MPKPMTRTNAREIAMHFLFELTFSNKSASTILEERLTVKHFLGMEAESPLYAQLPDEKQKEYIITLVEGAFLHGPELDEYISRYAKGWSFSRIPKVIATLMQVAMFEMIYMEDIPNSAAINSAIEIAKGYDDPEVISFMNGILGTFLRTEFKDTPLRPSQHQDEVFASDEAKGDIATEVEDALQALEALDEI